MFIVQEFQGSSDRYTETAETIDPPITAQYLRIKPKVWHGHISMRVEFYGCTEGKFAVFELDGATGHITKKTIVTVNKGK